MMRIPIIASLTTLIAAAIACRCLWPKNVSAARKQGSYWYLWRMTRSSVSQTTQDLSQRHRYTSYRQLVRWFCHRVPSRRSETDSHLHKKTMLVGSMVTRLKQFLHHVHECSAHDCRQTATSPATIACDYLKLRLEPTKDDYTGFWSKVAGTCNP